MIRDRANIDIAGFIEISDADTGERMLSTRNAIHKENMAIALAMAMTNSRDSAGLESFVNEIQIGDDGSYVTHDGQMHFRSPFRYPGGAGSEASEASEASLYRMRHSKPVDHGPNPGINSDTTHMRVSHEAGSGSATIRIMCVLEGTEPGLPSNSGSDFVFDEIGVRSQHGRLLAHTTFQPIRKLANQRVRIEYALVLNLGEAS